MSTIVRDRRFKDNPDNPLLFDIQMLKKNISADDRKIEFEKYSSHNLHSLSELTDLYASEISTTINYGELINALEQRKDISEKLELSIILKKISQITISSQLVELVPQIMRIFKQQDKFNEDILNNLLFVIEKIFSTISTPISSELLDFQVSLLNSYNPCFQLQALSTLKHLILNEQNLISFLSRTIDFDHILQMSPSSSYQTEVLLLIIQILPISHNLEPIMPKDIYHFKSTHIKQEFVRTIQQALLHALYENPLSIPYLLLAIAMTLSSHLIHLDAPYFGALLGFSFSKQCLPYILANVIYFKDSQVLADSPLPSILKSSEPDPKFSKWYNKGLTYLFKHLPYPNKSVPFFVILSLPELIKQLETIDPIQFLYNGGVQHLLNLLDDPNILKDLLTHNESSQISSIKEIENLQKELLNIKVFESSKKPILSSQKVLTRKTSSEPDEHLTKDNLLAVSFKTQFQAEDQVHFSFRPLIKFIGTLLNLIYIPPPLYEVSPNISDSIVQLQVQISETFTINLRVPLMSSLSLIEGIINLQVNKFDHEKLNQNLNPHLLPTKKQFNPSQLSIAFRASEPNYPHLAFLSNGHTYTTRDSVFSIFCDSTPDPSKILQTIPLLTITTEKDHISNSHPKVQHGFSLGKINPHYGSLLSLVKKLNTFGYEFKPKKLDSRVLSNFNNKITTAGRFSPALGLVFDHPYLFSAKTRTIAFQSVSFDPLYFTDPSGPQQWPIIAIARRKNLFAEGCQIIEDFCASRSNLEVRFIGEKGVGPGPTREFFSEMCRLFYQQPNLFRNINTQIEASSEKNDYQRNNNTSKQFISSTTNDISDNENLFPAPNAKPSLFSTLGLLVAKALSMNITLGISLSPAFIKLLQGHQITLEEVDPQLSSILSNPDMIIAADATFVYPGYPQIELIPNGENIDVDQSNYSQYAQLVSEFTVGKKAKQCAAAFLEGFGKLLPSSIIGLFSPHEFSSLLRGETRPLSLSDLEHIESSNGYSDDSLQIKWLKETLCELSLEQQQKFFQFVTGCSHLPIGGISSLKPPMMVDLKTDENDSLHNFLPTASVCANLLHLPLYPDKETLKSKIIQASNIGTGTFALS